MSAGDEIYMEQVHEPWLTALQDQLSGKSLLSGPVLDTVLTPLFAISHMPLSATLAKYSIQHTSQEQNG